jgi:hypothetical protein
MTRKFLFSTSFFTDTSTEIMKLFVYYDSFKSPASRPGGLGSRPGQSTWDLWREVSMGQDFSLNSSVIPSHYSTFVPYSCFIWVMNNRPTGGRSSLPCCVTLEKPYALGSLPTSLSQIHTFLRYTFPVQSAQNKLIQGLMVSVRPHVLPQ